MGKTQEYSQSFKDQAVELSNEIGMRAKALAPFLGPTNHQTI